MVGGFNGRVVAFLVGLIAFVSLSIGCCGCPELRDMGCLVVWRLLRLEVATAHTLGCYTGPVLSNSWKNSKQNTCRKPFGA